MSEQHLGTKMDSCTETQTETFEIPIPELFDDHLPKFEKPTEIGYFSLDIVRKFEIPEEKEGFLRYFIRPANPDQVNFDLRKGYDTRIIKAKGKEFNLLTWIRKQVEVYLNPEDTNGRTEGASGSDGPKKCAPPNNLINEDKDLAGLQSGLSKMKTSTKETPDLPISADRINRLLNADFVCRRGLLAKIMLIPYEKREDWLIAVTLHDGTYYLHEIEKDEAITYDEMCCWGWKFEQYLTSVSKDGPPDTDAPYNNCEAFYTVVRTELNNHSLVFSGEVDASKDVGNGNRSYYMELKTSKKENLTGYKIKKWWAQSYIIGVEEIVCGFRDDEGIVHNIEYYNTKDLPGLEKDVKNQLKPNVCLNVLDQFLSIIKAFIKTDDHSIVHTLKWSPEQPESILYSGPFTEPFTEPFTDPEYNFLPTSFTAVVK